MREIWPQRCAISDRTWGWRIAQNMREIQPHRELFRVAVSVHARASASSRACEWLAAADPQPRYVALDSAPDGGRRTGMGNESLGRRYGGRTP